MIPAEFIKWKRDGNRLPKKDLRKFIKLYLNGTVPEYQMAALLMAIYFNGMEDEEIFSLVELMLNSGKRMDFSHLDAYVADKHSTGGVGDKVSIILGPLMAAAGLAIPMLSGRSLGHTGGTLDKLETIPGFKVEMSLMEFKRQVETVGIAMIGQTAEICPADKKMYALRDVTGTIESIPLICGSIMSKKIAEGIRGLVLDVKTGNGAFMKTLKEAQTLGTMLQRIGKTFDVETTVVYSSMEQPLGRTAGLWCEVQEAIDGLLGKGPDDTMEVTFELGAKLLQLAGIVQNKKEAYSVQETLIKSGKAYDTFVNMVQAQGGDPECLEHISDLHRPQYMQDFLALRTGVIQALNTYRIGIAAIELGSGRKKASDQLDPTSGLEFLHKIGAKVSAGEPLIRCFNSNREKLELAVRTLNNSIKIGEEPASHQLILE